MRKQIAILILLAILGIMISGCYTQIKLTKTTPKTASEWEERNRYYRRYHRPCYWCDDWHYYYHYPWWLDQNYWWEEHSHETDDEIEYRRERSTRRRGLGDALDAIIDGLDESDRHGDDDAEGSESRQIDRDSGDESDSNDTQENNSPPPRRRGM